MSGKQRKPKRNNIATKRNSFVGDVTLQDFANAEGPRRGRVKKSDSVLVRGVSQLQVEDGSSTILIDSGDDERTQKIQRKKKVVKKVDVGTGGRTYPIDIWFILSKYIRPEDVSAFACICRSTHHVVSTVTFWRHLYQKYNPDTTKTPEQLKPERLIRNCGLRACVIRALFLLYKPLVDRCKSKMLFEADPRQLIKRQCVLVWCEKSKNNNWVYWFKLHKTDSSYGRTSIYNTTDTFKTIGGVVANPEEGCKYLKITCPSYIPTPMVLGQTLMSVSLTLDHSLRNKIQLVFGSGPRNIVDYNSTSFILSPVSHIHVLDWWHPLYPYPHGSLRMMDDF